MFDGSILLLRGICNFSVQVLWGGYVSYLLYQSPEKDSSPLSPLFPRAQSNVFSYLFPPASSFLLHPLAFFLNHIYFCSLVSSSSHRGKNEFLLMRERKHLTWPPPPCHLLIIEKQSVFKWGLFLLRSGWIPWDGLNPCLSCDTDDGQRS